jgi:hypothetical protein
MPEDQPRRVETLPRTPSWLNMNGLITSLADAVPSCELVSSQLAYSASRWEVAVPWVDARAARDVVTRHDGTLTVDGRRILVIEDTTSVLTLTTQAPVHQIAVAVAVAAEALDLCLQAEQVLVLDSARTISAHSLAEALEGPDSVDLVDLLWEQAARIYQEGPFGEPVAASAASETLAVLLAGNAATSRLEIGPRNTPERTGSAAVLAALTKALRRTPDLLDVARALGAEPGIEAPAAREAPARAGAPAVVATVRTDRGRRASTVARGAAR